MIRLLRSLLADDRASPSAEMALSLPLMFGLLFGSIELGNYFLSEHKVAKAVRDGARYAARRPLTDYASCTPSSTLIDETRNVTRTGQVAAGGTPKVWNWTDPTSITVSAACDTSGTYSGIYVVSTVGTPVVTVTATVPYASVLGQLGLPGPALNLNATSEAAVTGI
ncbi:MAG TPA: TadE/TadG family type IV pilus assembly protein [Sphingomicrobium sp.]|nr:TadE/TadG family type IV pilus assembly protein [Sphingomicrobium sp.]